MSPIILVPIGLVAGLVASAVMNGFQSLAAKPFGAESDSEPSTVKAADSISEATTDTPVAKAQRPKAGQAVHYATGAALGLGYVMLADALPATTLGFGALFGVVVAVLLDDLVVPALGWGSWPTKTPLNVHAYGIVSHIVFGVALEGVRRLGLLLLA